MRKSKKAAGMEQIAMKLLPFIEAWKPGAPVCTSADFDELLLCFGKKMLLHSDLFYFLAGAANEPSEQQRRTAAILNARLSFEGAAAGSDMEQAVATDHAKELTIPPGAKRQAALDTLRGMVPEEVEEEENKNLILPATVFQERKPEYLINPYLPRGMLAIMGGVSGVGKTWLALSWAAAITNGKRLPFLSPFDDAPAPGNVFYFTQENDPEYTIKYRLRVLGADQSRFYMLNSDNKEPLTLNDQRLEDVAEQVQPTLIIFDPIQSYLGAEKNMDKANEVRPVLDWLGNYSRRHICTTMLISHMGKPGAGNYSALDRLLGSSDFRNAARSIIVVGNDPENKEIRVFAHGKNSIGLEGESQRYHITSGEGVVYDGPCEYSADDIVKQSQPQHRAKPAVTLTAARKLLENLLGQDGFITLEQAEELQEREGISQRTFYRAKTEIALQSVSIGNPPNRKTWWLLPEVDAAQFKLEHTPPPEQLNFANCEKSNIAK